MSADKKKKRKPNIKRIVLAVLLLLAVIAGGLIISFFLFRHHGKKQLQATNTREIRIQEIIPEEDIEDDGTINYKGGKYIFNPDVMTFLFMGIDHRGDLPDADEVTDYRKGGQADALILMVVNHKTKKVNLININRNAMAEMDVYSKDGEMINTEVRQICLAHGYGTGHEDSCERQVEAVSRLFNFLQINGYYSLELNGVAELNDYMGGVEVEVLENIPKGSKELKNSQGKIVTLMGEDARIYVQYRDVKSFNSVESRMARQKQYISALFAKILEKTKEDATFPVKLLDILKDYTVTDLDASKISYLATTCVNYEFDTQNIYTLSGENVVNEDGYEEFYVDEDSLKDLIFDLFYEKIE
ncbi:MAG: LCP family protein [Lachnospiraceae bacterium]|nr:LCP family protein [Lachnospiraceae bacterium]